MMTHGDDGRPSGAPDTTDRATVGILIVGAGMTGLAAASALQQSGREVLAVDKGRGVGGRLATRRIGPATFDHGAQFITAREPRFASAIEEWTRNGVVTEWSRGFGGRPDGHPRWRGAPVMTSIAKFLARTLEIRLECPIVSLRLDGGSWVAATATGERMAADAVVLTPPVPQGLALLEEGGFGMDPGVRRALQEIQYERCLAVLAVLEGPSRVPPPGGFAPASGPVAWIADNQAKGISPLPAVTVHATDAFSREHWDDDRREAGRELLRVAGDWMGQGVQEYQVHGWRFSKPVRVEEAPCLVIHEAPPLVLAGDAFGGGRVEGAALSGWAAADAILRLRAPE